MSPTSLTALIITIHDLYALTAGVIFAIIFVVAFFIFCKLRIAKKYSALLALIGGLALTSLVSESLLGKRPISFELVRAG